MKKLSDELEKLNAYSGVECAKQILKLYKAFPDYEKQIDAYIENRTYAVIASADRTIAMAMEAKRQLQEEYAEEYAF